MYLSYVHLIFLNACLCNVICHSHWLNQCSINLNNWVCKFVALRWSLKQENIEAPLHSVWRTVDDRAGMIVCLSKALLIDQQCCAWMFVRQIDLIGLVRSRMKILASSVWYFQFSPVDIGEQKRKKSYETRFFSVLWSQLRADGQFEVADSYFFLDFHVSLRSSV